MVVVYGGNNVVSLQGDEIVGVARLPQSDRYCIPESLRFSEDRASTATARRVERLDKVGSFGTMSCSPVRLGAFTGCTQQLVHAAAGDRREGSEARFSELTPAAPAERLSTIGAEASAEQARVERLVKHYMERLEREREGALTSDQPATDPATSHNQPLSGGNSK